MREETGERERESEREGRPAPPSAPVPESREHPRAAWTARQMEARAATRRMQGERKGGNTAAALLLMCRDGGRYSFVRRERLACVLLFKC